MSIKVLSNVKICQHCESVLFYDDLDVTSTETGSDTIKCPVCGSILPVVRKKKESLTILEDLGILGH